MHVTLLYILADFVIKTWFSDSTRNLLQNTYTSQISPQSQLKFLSLFYFVRSQHVSAPTGHPQVKYIIYIISVAIAVYLRGICII
jgi:hypothetical protein